MVPHTTVARLAAIAAGSPPLLATGTGPLTGVPNGSAAAVGPGDGDADADLDADGGGDVDGGADAVADGDVPPSARSEPLPGRSTANADTPMAAPAVSPRDQDQVRVGPGGRRAGGQRRL
ncbi:hypothetical protein, partial [Nonomuraea sp. NPDC049709]|uniref:hypothetical protein n=1 Tax=Nonomuraea sp. NPDC049709 TaxID=3154736 RepID=UPI0034446CD4